VNVFDLDRALVGDYERFARSFTQIRAHDILSQVEQIYATNRFCPEPLISINPNFERGASVADLAADGSLHPDTARAFRWARSHCGIRRRNAAGYRPDQAIRRVLVWRTIGQDSIDQPSRSPAIALRTGGKTHSDTGHWRRLSRLPIDRRQAAGAALVLRRTSAVDRPGMLVDQVGAARIPPQFIKDGGQS
jgi:hypothetical protein